MRTNWRNSSHGSMPEHEQVTSKRARGCTAVARRESREHRHTVAGLQQPADSARCLARIAVLFAVLVIMAVVTTLMASPIFERLVGTGTYQPTPEPELHAAR